MKTTIEKTQKRCYLSPQIEQIMLDKEISLALESPPAGPNETNLSPQYLRNDPFKNNLA